MTTLSSRDRKSTVVLGNDYVYKTQPKYLTDNEIWCLRRMEKYGCAPKAEQVDIETIKMEFIVNEPITDIELFMFHANLFLHRLEKENIRHGDLTKPHVLVRGNQIYVIDWAESRHWYDPRPNKRREGDKYWWKKTVKQLLAPLNSSS